MKSAETRKVHQSVVASDFFYNPMWRAYGHQTHPDAGAATYHWSRKWAHEPGWHMLDQVVLRPGESEHFPEGQLRVVTRIGDISLLDNQGLPDRQTASDHLPLIFEWNP